MRRRRRPPFAASRRELGSISPLIIGFVVIILLLITGVYSVSLVFLAERDITAAADGAALAAANGIAVESVYTGGLGGDVELSQAAARKQVEAYIWSTGIDSEFDLASPVIDVSADGTEVTVTLEGSTDLPFTEILGGTFSGGYPVDGVATATVVATQ